MSSGFYKFTYEFVSKDFDEQVDSMMQAMDQLIIGKPQVHKSFAETQAHAEAIIAQALLGPLYTERRGILYRDDRAVGTTRPGPADNRLRRFVKRRGILVEVRSRGRGGARCLAAAIDPPKGSSYAAAAAHSMLAAWPT